MSRFSRISTQDIDMLLEDRTSRYTKRVINVAKRLMDAFCLETGHCYESMNKRELIILLQQFYAGMRSKTGKRILLLRSMISMRYGIQKYFIKKCEIDGVNDNEFKKKVNEVFYALCAKLGKGQLFTKNPFD